jgi:putative FmdB family regulatory protein
MPTYDYQCDACLHRFEAFQSMSDKALRKCPACKKPKLQRLIGAGAGVIFKGSGFYQTDYRGSAFKEDARKDSEPVAGGCGGTCGTPDAPAGCPMAKQAKKGKG